MDQDAIMTTEGGSAQTVVPAVATASTDPNSLEVFFQPCSFRSLLIHAHFACFLSSFILVEFGLYSIS